MNTSQKVSVRVLVAILLAICPFAIAKTEARELHVDNVAGNDALPANATLPAVGGFGPYRTIEHALRLAEPGDRIVINWFSADPAEKGSPR